MKDWLLERKITVLIAVFMVLGGFYYFYLQQEKEVVPSAALPFDKKIDDEKGLKQQEPPEQTKQKETPEQIVVDVKGQIKQPGVYQVYSSDRVIDVISKAGGLTDHADQSQVNFAQHLQDEMVIYIPAKGEEAGAPISSIIQANPPRSTSSQIQTKININQADEAELQNLPGVGPAKAAAIIEYRKSSGPFKTVEDLKNISGIGDKTFEKLKDLIAVQ